MNNKVLFAFAAFAAFVISAVIAANFAEVAPVMVFISSAITFVCGYFFKKYEDEEEMESLIKANENIAEEYAKVCNELNAKSTPRKVIIKTKKNKEA